MAHFDTPQSALSGGLTEFGNSVEHFKRIQEAMDILVKIEPDISRLAEMAYLFDDVNGTDEMVENFNASLYVMQERLGELAKKTSESINQT